MLGLCCCTRVFSSWGEWRLSFVVALGLLTQRPLRSHSTGSRRAGVRSCGAWASHAAAASVTQHRLPSGRRPQLRRLGSLAARPVGSPQTRDGSRVSCTGRQTLLLVVIPFIVCFRLHSVFTAGRGLPLAAASRSCSLVAVHGLLTAVASLVEEHGLEGAWASVIAACGLRSCGSRALEYRLNRWGAWTWLLCSLWDLPRSGILGTDVSCTGR